MAPFSSSRPGRPWFVTVHTGEGILDADDMAAFLDGNPNASAHAASDAEEVRAPLVPYLRAAWTAGATANDWGLHIEVCAFVALSREQWLSEEDVDVWVPYLNKGAGAWRRIRSPRSMLRNTAAWVRARCDEFGITKRKITATDLRNDVDGICGHADTSAAWRETDHTDPGKNWPWDVFIAMVNDQDVQPEEDFPMMIMGQDGKYYDAPQVFFWMDQNLHTLIAKVDALTDAISDDEANVIAAVRAQNSGGQDGGPVDVVALANALTERLSPEMRKALADVLKHGTDAA